MTEQQPHLQPPEESEWVDHYGVMFDVRQLNEDIPGTITDPDGTVRNRTFRDNLNEVWGPEGEAWRFDEAEFAERNAQNAREAREASRRATQGMHNNMLGRGYVLDNGEYPGTRIIGPPAMGRIHVSAGVLALKLGQQDDTVA